MSRRVGRIVSRADRLRLDPGAIVRSEFDGRTGCGDCPHEHTAPPIPEMDSSRSFVPTDPIDKWPYLGLKQGRFHGIGALD